ncbi:unnamed protein product [Wickerhamomyces anomalus]
MSDNESQRTKKQFKSQSVNNLFRQQVTNSSSSDGNNHEHPLLIKKKSTGSATKLKLVSKKSNTVNRTKLEKKKAVSKETSPPVWSKSQSPEVKETNQDNEMNKENEPEVEQKEEKPVEQTIKSQTPETTVVQEPVDNFNWADEDEDNIWLDLQNQIHNETKPPTRNEQTLWSSPSSKISSFRKSTTPTISSLNQSPLVSSSNDIFNEPNDLFTLQSTQVSNDSRYNSHPPTPNYVDENLWNQNYNLWNSDDRQLSTKSDSTLLWSPFNNKRKDLDDPLKSLGLDSQARQTTSRFFPSPQIEQENAFGVQTKNIPTLAKRTPEKKPKQELFPEHFNVNNNTAIPVSFPGSYTTQQEVHQQQPRPQPQEQYYPEGFASTFYKRGINNFMFVRELQPKLITSKSKDTVEVRISLPSINTNIQSEEDIFFKMRCYIINVGLRELNGKNSGYKLSQKSNNINANNGNYGRPRYGNATFTRKQGYTRR